MILVSMLFSIYFLQSYSIALPFSSSFLYVCLFVCLTICLSSCRFFSIRVHINIFLSLTLLTSAFLTLLYFLLFLPFSHSTVYSKSSRTPYHIQCSIYIYIYIYIYTHICLYVYNIYIYPLPIFPLRPQLRYNIT